MSIETTIHLNKFKPRPYQIPICKAIASEGGKYRKLICVLPRRAGKDVLLWNLVIRAALKEVGNYFYCLPTFSQARTVIWDSITNDGQKFLDFIPESIIAKIRNDTMQIVLINGSQIKLIGSDSYDTSIIGSNPKMIVFSEYALADENAYKLAAMPILRANNGIVVMISTPRGKNHMYELFEIAKNSPEWFTYFQTVEDTQHIDVEDIKKDIARGEISADMARQEYFCFPAGQHVLTSLGSKPIELITPDEMVVSHSGRLRKVLGVISREYSGKLYEIHSYGSSEPIVCTPDHPIRVYDRSSQKYKWKKAEEVENDDRLAFPKMTLGKAEIISKQMIKLIAWYITEGISFKNGVQWTVKESEAVDVAILLIGLGIEYEKFPGKGCVNVVVYSVQFVDFFKSVCGTQASNKRIPFHLISGHEEDFFEELIKGDGCHNISNGHEKYSYTTVSKTLAYQVQLLANSLNLGYAAGISKRDAYKGIIEGREVDCQESYQVNISFPGLKREGGKLMRAKNCIAALVKQINIIPRFEGTVYNLKVQYDESYLVHGRAVHNCSFEMGQEGSLYAKYIDKMRLDGRIGIVPWEPYHKVYTSWDLGIADPTCIIFFQVIGELVRVIDYYEQSDRAMDHFAKIVMEKPYVYATNGHFPPHDIMARESARGLTKREMYKELGIKFTEPVLIDIQDGIELVRRTFSKMWIDEKNCKQLIKALENYRYEWDDKLKRYKSKPLHDWSSHACFTGDTKVLTRHGMLRIMDIEENDEVLTLCGWKKCSKAQMTKTNVPVVQVTFQDGTTVKCTPDHLFLTTKGWKSAESLTRGTVIQSFLINSLNTLKGLYTDFGRMKDIFLRQASDCTEQSGSGLLEGFLLEITYTTETVTPLIITSGTWNASQKKTILDCLDQITRDLVLLLGMRQRLGTRQWRGDCGIVGMPHDAPHGLNGEGLQKTAFNAIDNLSVLFGEMDLSKNFVTPTAKQLTIEGVRYLKGELFDVWDITVPNIGHFSLSNGAIVHNSDSLRYLCAALPKCRTGSSPEDLERRYQEAMYGNNSRMPSVFRDDVGY